MLRPITCFLALLGLGSSVSAAVDTNAVAAAANDLTVLNYALTLENLEAGFYNQGLAKFNASAFANAGYNGTIYAYLQMIQSHENSHVSFLTNAINTASSGAAVPACQYNFTAALASPAAFLTTATALENAGQTAYDGGINGITNADYAQVAAQIATVEARHAAWLNNITNSSPFPNAFDTANLPSMIASMVGPFIVSCPYTITLPSIRPSGVKLNSSNQVVATGSLTPSYTDTQKANDITALNFALTLEHLENAFYKFALSHFTSDNFTSAGLPSYYYDYSVTIASHELVHVQALNATINGRVAGAAVPPCVYNFSSVTNVTQYLTVAKMLENLGVQAYDGAVNTITDTDLQQIAATIATVEARHAAFLNQVNGVSPFPDNQDVGLAPSSVISAALQSGLIVSCPYEPTAPVVVPVATNYNAATGHPLAVQLVGAAIAISALMAL